MNLSELFIETKVLKELENQLRKRRQSLEQRFREKVCLRHQQGTTLSTEILNTPTISMIYDIGLDEFVKRCKHHQKQAADPLSEEAAAQLALRDYLEVEP